MVRNKNRKIKDQKQFCSVTSEDIIAAFPEFKIINVNIKQTPNGTSRGFGYVQLESVVSGFVRSIFVPIFGNSLLSFLLQADVEKSLTFDRRPIKGRPTFISSVLRDKEKRSVFKYSESVEKTKLFVKGLSFDATKSDLEKLFGEFGTLKDVRLVYQK